MRKPSAIPSLHHQAPESGASGVTGRESARECPHPPDETLAGSRPGAGGAVKGPVGGDRRERTLDPPRPPQRTIAAGVRRGRKQVPAKLCSWGWPWVCDICMLADCWCRP